LSPSLEKTLDRRIGGRVADAMSKPFVAKGIGTRSQARLYARLMPVLPRQLRGSAADGTRSQDQREGQAVIGPASGINHCLLEEGDPLPPDHDRAPLQPDPLESLYREERPSLLRFLSRWTGRDKAEDIVQQVFSRMAGKPNDETGPIVAPKAYLRKAAHNVLHDEARTASRSCAHQHIPIEDLSLSGGDPVAALEARDRLARIEQAVLRLKPLTREIFLACRLDGYSYAEIAERTGLSVRGVEKQMSRAIKQLGRHLRAHD